MSWRWCCCLSASGYCACVCCVCVCVCVYVEGKSKINYSLHRIAYVYMPVKALRWHLIDTSPDVTGQCAQSTKHTHTHTKQQQDTQRELLQSVILIIQMVLWIICLFFGSIPQISQWICSHARQSRGGTHSGTHLADRHLPYLGLKMSSVSAESEFEQGSQKHS